MGSTVVLGDSTGTLQTQYTYEPFGATSATGVASTNSYKYTGREDDGSGLYYYRARYYHPRLQRFISEDPIGFGGGDANLYGYVGNMPIIQRDPTGLLWWGGHFWITLNAAFHAGYSFWDAAELAWAVMAVDGREGSQQPVPASTKLHAMRTPGQSCDDARRAVNDLISGRDPLYANDLQPVFMLRKMLLRHGTIFSCGMELLH